MAEYKFGRELQETDLSGKTDRCVGIQSLYEQVVCHFINDHQMDEMVGDGNIVSRQLVAGRQGFDIETESACIEIKVFMRSLDRNYDYMQERFHQSIKQIIEDSNSSTALTRDKRRILLVVGQEGINKEIRKLANQERIKSLWEAADAGLVELWTAEIKFEPTDGITLLSYGSIGDILMPDEKCMRKGGDGVDG